MIELDNLSLAYTIHHERSYSLKETIINLFHKRSYVQKSTEKFLALKDINLNVKQGEQLAIIGRNGAGKSSMLKIISGILKPTQGTVSVDGTIQPLIELAAGFNPEFSGRENIYLNGYMLGFSRKQLKEQEKAIIDFSELERFIDVPVKYYSSGMVVRLAFTIATSIEPEVLLLDEMLSAGDAAFLKKARSRMDSLVKRAKAVVLVSHDLNLVKEFASRALVLENGSIAFDGSPSDAVEFYLATVET